MPNGCPICGDGPCPMENKPQDGAQTPVVVAEVTEVKLTIVVAATDTVENMLERITASQKERSGVLMKQLAAAKKADEEEVIEDAELVGATQS